ncbi:peptidylprolyl isomerase [Acetobacter sp. AN02]|uniref:peptidylprolyl isomerase n=1 Tax=Acetobacter sp. AN02 TaxID=2894186 RepID=UPI00243415B8|nr:peptidylprolyl isomerase [Acetobacter sp. AN02]MDG6093798.1 peptidylprolyl isomerase [Acetobacter sp. AN02]
MVFARVASLLSLGALLSSSLTPVAAFAADAPAAAKPAAAATPAQEAPIDPNATIATVNGQKITVADVQKAAANVPPQLRQLPEKMILPMLVKQMVDQKAIQILAHQEKLQDKPEVQEAMQHAADNALQSAWLSDQVKPLLTDDAIKAYYDKNYASKKPEEEVHARHILVKTEAEAKDIIAKLKGGANFGTLAEKLSTDTGSAKQNGGDLGWFKKGDMIPAFSDAAFAMKPNTYSQTPVKTQYGWHVIQVLETRTAPVPKLDEVKDKIRQDILQKGISDAVAKAEKAVKIVRYDPTTGKPLPDAPETPAAAPAKP